MARKTGKRTIREINEAGRQSAELVEVFMREHLHFTAGPLAGKPFIITPEQRANIIRPIFGTLNARGERVYREAVLGRPRWAGKSQTGSALVLTSMYLEPEYEGEYYAVATTKKQAGIVFTKAKRMIYADPLLRAISKIYRDAIEIPETGAVFRALPWDADTAQGFHPAGVTVIDEYHVHRDASMREAMLSGMIGSPNALLVTISTAGPERRGPLWELMCALVGPDWQERVPFAGAAPADPAAYVSWIGAADGDDGHDPKVWRKANPGAWIKIAALRRQHRGPFPVFERYHLNRFPSSGTNRAYPADLWHAGAAIAPIFDPDRPTILGLDASWTRDTTALVMVQRDAGGRLHAWAQVWRKDGALGHIDHEAVEAKILELAAAYNVVRIAADPNYFTRSMLKLEHEYKLPVEEFPQDSRRMSSASMTLYDVIQEGRLVHGGARDLTEHVLNAGVRATSYGWRITKIEDARKIDAAVALAIAVYLAEAEAAAFAPSFAQTGGVWSIDL